MASLPLSAIIPRLVNESQKSQYATDDSPQNSGKAYMNLEFLMVYWTLGPFCDDRIRYPLIRPRARAHDRFMVPEI
jgi:hypothetical protein